MSGDDYVALSPSTHTVPCSPFLRYNRDSPVPCVPDIDRLIGRRLHYNSNQGIFFFHIKLPYFKYFNYFVLKNVCKKFFRHLCVTFDYYYTFNITFFTDL